MVDVKEVEEKDVKKLIISRGGAQAEVYLFGATVTKFTTRSGKDLIWLSKTAKLDGTKAIRGGIPLVFPQFGQPIQTMPQHGFARSSVWTYESKTVDGVVLTLDQSQASHKDWQYSYKLRFAISVSDEVLKTTYSVENTGPSTFNFMNLQHTYLNVGDISKTSVYGLDGKRFLDKTTPDPTALWTENRRGVGIGEFTDRVYVNPGTQIKVSCPTGDIQVSGSAYLNNPSAGYDPTCVVSPDIVVWNPWEKNAKGMADFDDDGYKQMLCIEPGLVSAFHMLPPQGTFDLVQEIALLP